MIKKILSLALTAAISASALTFVSCGKGNEGGNENPNKGTDFSPAVSYKIISKQEYTNKTLGGLLGQFAGFLSGYEFAGWGGNSTGFPEEWFDFINGPYAGNYTYYTPPGSEGDRYKYDRLKINEQTGRNEVWSDDDYHIDIFNQYVLKEQGFSSYAIKNVWKKYTVSDWGGGMDAMMLISSKDMLAPYTGTIEAGNRYGWCTEAYIENETLGMNAPGMPNTATLLVDKFASNVGYFDSVVWAKFYAAMYSLAYFEDDVITVMQKAKEVLPNGSFPQKTYDLACELYNKYPDDYKSAASELADQRRMLYRIDNIQTDPNVNGGFAILSFLYGKNSYLDTCKYSSIMGYDGDCTAAICSGVMGIIKGFKPTNEEYKKLNDMIYYDGEGVYYNDEALYTSDGTKPYDARIVGKNYPVRQKIDDIVDMYRENFETILLENGGEIAGENYKIPTTPIIKDRSLLFKNYDAEERDTSSFNKKNGTLECIADSDNPDSHSGYACFAFKNTSNGEVWHTFDNLVKGRTYRLSVYVKTSANAQLGIFARESGKAISSEISFANATSLINKEFLFTATGSKMEVGFKFASSSAKDDLLYFDDFMLEETNETLIEKISDSNLSLYSGKFIKTVTLPKGAQLKKEVILSIKYRNYSGQPIICSLMRNGDVFGGVVASSTSKNSSGGYSYLRIPYIFEKNTDTIQLQFDSEKMYIGEISVLNSTQFMFR